MNNIKEFNFIKQVERQSKYDAYTSVLSWAKSNVTKEDIIWYLEQKIEGHEQYLKSLPYEYCYATQSLREKMTIKFITKIDEDIKS